MRYLETLVSNRGGNIRREHVDGRDYLVAPLSMIVPGVLNGSKGPLLYPLDEISRNADQWNNIPIVLHHPMDGGRAIRARSPQVLERYQLGTVYNARVSDKLRAEGWFDVERTKRLASDTYAKLVKGEPEELSTGLFTDNHPVKNDKTDDGKPYVAVARNYRPDHLAILPGKRGACAITDGCGVNVNEAADEPDWWELVDKLRDRSWWI